MRSERVMTLPEDIVKYVKKKVIRCISLFVICLCATIAISILTWNYFSTRTPLAFHIGVVFWINIIPFFIAKFPWTLIDKSWSGEVVDVSIEEKVGAYTVANYMGAYPKNIIYLNVKLDNGKNKCISIREYGRGRHIGFEVPNEGDVTKHLDDYSVGDRVYHFYGLKNYFVVKKNSSFSECVVCGLNNKKDYDKCASCGHSLIKHI